MDIKKLDPLPSALTGLKRYGTTSSRSSLRKDKERPDVAFGVETLEDLYDKLKRGFANPKDKA